LLYPQLNRVRNLLELGGLWQILPDTERVGEEAEWHLGLPDATLSVSVNASWNEQHRELYNFHGVVWYEKEFTLPRSFSTSSDRLFLRFGSVFYLATVWVNGKYCGEHIGGHLPFEFEVSELIQAGEANRIVVRVDAGITPNTLPPGTFNHQDGVFGYKEQFPPVAYDFFPYGGIHRPVYLYSTGSIRIEDIRVVTKLDGEVVYQVRLDGPSESGEVRLRVSSGQCLREDGVSSNSKEILSSFRINNPRLWDTNDPYLYTLRVELLDKEKLLDEYTLNYGIREIRLRGTEFLLNGKPVFLKGFGKHEDFPIVGKGLVMGVIVKDFDLLRWIGANSVRTSHYPYAEEFLDYADRSGVLVIAETPFVALSERLYQPEILEQVKKVINELIERDKNHPSVVMWSLANEPRVASEAGAEFFKAMYDYARKMDSTRPILYVANLGPSENLGLKYFDLIGLNRYHGWYDLPAQLAEAAERFEESLEQFYREFNKPLLIAEFGADAVAGLHSDADLLFSEEYQANFIEMYYRIIRSKTYCIGAHVWAFADFRTAQHYTRVINNRKGVFTREREPKLAAHFLRKLWRE
jgi:beta-glucuronidase